MRALRRARAGRSKAFRSASRISSPPRASTPRRQAISSTASSRPMNRRSPAICGATARSCWASSTWTSSPWARPTRRATTAMSSIRGGARNSNAALVPGGSSGGSATAVAAHLCAGATATDTGGSIRQPAAFTGTVGIKPTYGRCSRWGIVAFASSLDQAGPIARDVRDAAIMLKSMASVDPKDTTSVDRAGARLRGGARPADQGPAGRHPQGISRRRHAAPRSTRCGQKGAQWLKEQGAEIVEISLPHTKYALPAYYIVAPAEASSNLARYDGVRYGLRVKGDDIVSMYENTRAEGLRPRGAAPHDDRHLCALGRLLRRLLCPGAEGPHTDQARFRRGLEQGRRGADAGDAERRLRAGRDHRSRADVSERHLHRDGQHGGPAGHRGAGGPERRRACRWACSSSASRSTRRRCSRRRSRSSRRPASSKRRSGGSAS